MQHIKSKGRNIVTGEEVIIYFTEQEWEAHTQATLYAEAAEAGRDLLEEELDKMTRGLKSFIKLYADREGLPLGQLKAAIKEEMKTINDK